MLNLAERLKNELTALTHWRHTYVLKTFYEAVMLKQVPISRYKPSAVPCDLYFIETQCAERHIKIGVASNIKQRLSTLQTHCPYKLVLLKLVPGAAHMEKQLHLQFSADRLSGEWFRRSDQLLAVIESLPGKEEPVKVEEDLLGAANIMDFLHRRGAYADLPPDEELLVRP